MLVLFVLQSREYGGVMDSSGEVLTGYVKSINLNKRIVILENENMKERNIPIQGIRAALVVGDIDEK